MLKSEYQEAEEKLRAYALGLGVPVRMIEGRTYPYYQAYFDMKKRRIRMNKGLRKDREKFIYVLAHEIGHCIDFDSQKKREWRRQAKVANLFHVAVAYGCKMPYQMRMYILSSEKRANQNGERLMRRLGILIPKQKIKRLRRDGIEGYTDLFHSMAHI